MPTGSIEDDDLDDYLEDADRNAGYAVEYGGDETFVDDDEYLEYTVSWDERPGEPMTRAGPVVHREPVVQADDWGYSPRKLGAHPPEGQGDILDEPLSGIPPVTPKAEPIGFAHNGFHVEEERFQPLPPAAPEEARPSRHERSARHYLSERNRRNGRSGSSRTVGIPVTTPTMHRATAGTRCRAATDSARAGSREQTQNARHAGVLAHFASSTLTS